MKVHVSLSPSLYFPLSSLLSICLPLPFSSCPLCPLLLCSISLFQRWSNHPLRSRSPRFSFSFFYLYAPLYGRTHLSHPTIVVRHGRHDRQRQIASQILFSFSRHYTRDEFGRPSSGVYANSRLIFPIWLTLKDNEGSRIVIATMYYICKVEKPESRGTFSSGKSK